MARFKPGQEVVCTSRYWVLFGRLCPGPKLNEIVHVAGYANDRFLYLSEYLSVVPSYGVIIQYPEMFFEPVVPQEEIEKLMEESKITA